MTLQTQNLVKKSESIKNLEKKYSDLKNNIKNNTTQDFDVLSPLEDNSQVTEISKLKKSIDELRSTKYQLEQNIIYVKDLEETNNNLRVKLANHDIVTRVNVQNRSENISLSEELIDDMKNKLKENLN